MFTGRFAALILDELCRRSSLNTWGRHIAAQCRKPSSKAQN